jgi:hypothetical protein
VPEAPTPPSTRRGPGRVLIAVYAVFAVSATARATVQIIDRFDEARLAYTLSAIAAAIYLVATAALALSPRIAVAACTIELVGVLGIGLFSYLEPDRFPDATVWSHFGQGYGFVPLVLPVLGLAWLWRSRSASG